MIKNNLFYICRLLREWLCRTFFMDYHQACVKPSRVFLAGRPYRLHSLTSCMLVRVCCCSASRTTLMSVSAPARRSCCTLSTGSCWMQLLNVKTQKPRRTSDGLGAYSRTCIPLERSSFLCTCLHHSSTL